jgi:hypothetical protein
LWRKKNDLTALRDSGMDHGDPERFEGSDPILIEKMIMALTLVEGHRLSGLDFIFRGGTSLLLLSGEPRRFSIDISFQLVCREQIGK